MSIQQDQEAKEKQAVNQMDSDEADLELSSDQSDIENAKDSLGYQQWKARELKRLLRDREEAKVEEEEKKDLERRRNLTDLQREEENLKLGTDHNQKK